MLQSTDSSEAEQGDGLAATGSTRLTLRADRPQQVILAGLAAASLVVVMVVLRFTGRGLDVTDESWYLLLLRDPSGSGPTVSSFGFVYAPLFDLLGGDAGLIRLVNVLVLMVLSWALMYRLVLGRPGQPAHSAATRAVVSLGAATAVLVTFSAWLLTPNYNTLNVTGMLLAFLGATMVNRQVTWVSVAGTIVISAGVVAVVLARPTTAVLIAVLLAAYLLIDRRLALWNVVTQMVAATVMLLLAAWVTAGGLAAFVERHRSGARFYESFDPTYGLSWLLSRLATELRHPTVWDQRHTAALTVALAVLTWLILALIGSTNRAMRLLGTSLCLVVLAFSVLLVVRPLPWSVLASQERGYLVLGPVLAAAFWRVADWWRNGRPVRGLRPYALPVVLAVAPFAFAFGSANHIWLQATKAGVFWVACALVLVAMSEPRVWLPRMLAFLTTVVLAVGLTVSTAVSYPYRQSENLATVDNRVVVGSSGAALLVDDVTAAYARDLRAAVQHEAGEEVPALLDLSGHTSGAAYLLGAHPVGGAWLLGGESGRTEVVESLLREEDCETLARAWVLVEPESPGTWPIDVLGFFGAEPADYRQVAVLQSPYGGVQHLLEPQAPAQTLQKCLQLRAADAG